MLLIIPVILSCIEVFALKPPCPCYSSRRLTTTKIQKKTTLLKYPANTTLSTLQENINSLTNALLCKPLPTIIRSEYPASVMLCPYNHACQSLKEIKLDFLPFYSNMSLFTPFITFNNHVYALDEHSFMFPMNISVIK